MSITLSGGFVAPSATTPIVSISVISATVEIHEFRELLVSPSSLPSPTIPCPGPKSQIPNPQATPMPLSALLAELAAFGDANDAAAGRRQDKMLNITPDTGEFLALMLRMLQARRVLEVGTSNGYSTLWLADAVRDIDGQVTTLEHSVEKQALARANFERAGLSPWISLVPGDAGAFLALPQPPYRLIFLDSERTEYPGWWPHLQALLEPGGLMVVDNATSHREEMAPFVELVNATPGYRTCLVTQGKGEFLIFKE